MFASRHRGRAGCMILERTPTPIPPLPDNKFYDLFIIPAFMATQILYPEDSLGIYVTVCKGTIENISNDLATKTETAGSNELICNIVFKEKTNGEKCSYSSIFSRKLHIEEAVGFLLNSMNDFDTTKTYFVSFIQFNDTFNDPDFDYKISGRIMQNKDEKEEYEQHFQYNSPSMTRDNIESIFVFSWFQNNSRFEEDFVHISFSDEVGFYGLMPTVAQENLAYTEPTRMVFYNFSQLKKIRF